MNLGGLSLVLISIFHQINHSKAVWDAERRGVIVNQNFPNFDYYFPLTIRMSPTHRKVSFIESSKENGDRTYYLCNHDPNGKEHEGCVFPHELEKGETDAFCYSANYENPEMVEPEALTLKRSQCGAGNYIGTHSGYFYRICKFKNKKSTSLNKSSTKTLLVYKVCYDITNKHNLYSSFTIESPQLFTNQYLSAEANVGFDYEYETVEHNGLTYGLNVVAPPKLVPFALQRAAFYERRNLAFRWVSLDEAWNSLVNELKNKLKVLRDPVHVFAGTYGTLASVRDSYNSFTIIPLIWWITIYNADKTKGTSIIMHNEHKDTVESHELYCDTSVCHYVSLNLSENEDMVMYCCHSNVISTELNLPLTNADSYFHFE